MMVRSDKLRVKQVLMNLFSNAIKFTKEGDVRIIC
jgi:signal transduction histidine kinase